MAEKKRVAGVVDRVEGKVAVIVFKDPNSGDIREGYVDKTKMKKVDLKEGDEVSIEMSRMAADSKTNTVKINFSGVKPGAMAKKFFSYLVDGGLEDAIIQALTGHGVGLEISGCDKKTLTVNFEVGKDKPAKKAVKKPAKTAKAAKKPVKKPVKKVSAKRGKRA